MARTAAVLPMHSGKVWDELRSSEHDRLFGGGHSLKTRREIGVLVEQGYHLSVSTLFESPLVQIESWACRRSSSDRDERVQPWPQVSFSKMGTYRFRQARFPVLVEPTAAIFIDSLIPYTTSAIDDHECGGWTIRVRDDLASALFQRPISKASERLSFFPLLRCSPRTFALERYFARIATRPDTSALQLEEISLSILNALAGDQRCQSVPRSVSCLPRHLELIERTREILLKSIGTNIGLAELGRRVGVSPWHLARIFRNRTGHTIHEYLSILRLRAALDLILDTRIDLTTIAIHLGYSHASHFGAAFSRAYGVTPSSIRRKGLKTSNLPAVTRDAQRTVLQ